MSSVCFNQEGTQSEGAGRRKRLALCLVGCVLVGLTFLTGLFLYWEASQPNEFKRVVAGNKYKLEFGRDDQDNVIIELSSGGSWDDFRIHHPCVVEKDNVIYLFYSGNDGSVWKIGAASASSVGFQGKGFRKGGGNPILSVGIAGAWDDKGVCSPFVLYDADERLWKMWYQGFDASGGSAVGYATSDHPERGWIKYEGNPVLRPTARWEGRLIGWSSILKENGHRYKMLFAGNDPNDRSSGIGLASSSDGIRWAKYELNPVLSGGGSGWEKNSVFSPRSLNVLDGEYHLLYCGKPDDEKKYSKIGYATSADLISWTRSSANPYLSPSKRWEGYEVESPFLFQKEDKCYIYYDCWYGNPKSIGGAILNSGGTMVLESHAVEKSVPLGWQKAGAGR